MSSPMLSLAWSMAARSEQSPAGSAQAGTPTSASGVSFVVLTSKTAALALPAITRRADSDTTGPRSAGA